MSHKTARPRKQIIHDIADEWIEAIGQHEPTMTECIEAIAILLHYLHDKDCPTC